MQICSSPKVSPPPIKIYTIILLSFHSFNTDTYIYVYIQLVLFGPVKPELGVIPSEQENHSGAEHLNFPGRELNVIDFTEQYFFKENWI